MDAVTFFVVAAAAVASALLVAVGSLAIVLWAGAAVISRSWKTASAWQKPGAAARVAMRVYLATIGRDKAGFSIVGREPDGTPVYLGDMRGVIERNTMRYYLAIEAHLRAYAVPPAEQPERRPRDWFAAVERYPRQSHDMELGDYLSMKH